MGGNFKYDSHVVKNPGQIWLRKFPSLGFKCVDNIYEDRDLLNFRFRGALVPLHFNIIGANKFISTIINLNEGSSDWLIHLHSLGINRATGWLLWEPMSPDVTDIAHHHQQQRRRWRCDDNQLIISRGLELGGLLRGGTTDELFPRTLIKLWIKCVNLSHWSGSKN